MSSNKLHYAGEVKNWLKIVRCARNGTELVERTAAGLPAGNWYMHGIYGFWIGQVACLTQRQVLALRGHSIPITTAHLGCTRHGCEGTAWHSCLWEHLCKRDSYSAKWQGAAAEDCIWLPNLYCLWCLRKGEQSAFLFLLLLARFAAKSGGRALISLEPSVVRASAQWAPSKGFGPGG